MDSLAMLAIAIGAVTLIGMGVFYLWFKHSEKKHKETMHAQ